MPRRHRTGRALALLAICALGSSCSSSLFGPDDHTQAVLRQGAIRLLRPPPGTFRLGCNWNTHSAYSEVACRAVYLVPPGLPSPAVVEWLVTTRARVRTLDQSIFGSWDGRDVDVIDKYVGVADGAGGFRAYRFACKDINVLVQLETDPRYVSPTDRAKAGCTFNLDPESDTFVPA